MFWKLFSNKRKQTISATWLDTLQDRTRAWGLRISGWLERKTKTLSRVRLKTYAVLFLLFFGTWNGWIVYRAVDGCRSPSPVGQQIFPHSTLPTVRSPVDPSSLSALRQFRCWLDSLQRDSVGGRIYDSILHGRPGLLDSLGQVEKGDFIHQ